MNLIDNIIKKLNSERKGYFDIFNSGKGNSISILNLLKILSSKLKINPKIQKKEKQIGDVFYTSSSSKKIKNKLNFEPNTSLKKALIYF